MTMRFADTFYFIALLSPRDEAHSKAIAFTQRFTGRLLTTAWVLTEIADGLTDELARDRFIRFYDRLRVRDDVVIVASDEKLFDQGIELYRRRLDKNWSLTDCISFVVMQERNVSEALTADHHFEQAGFTALLK
jgi:predicted nucleic acid-binding protein